LRVSNTKHLLGSLITAFTLIKLFVRCCEASTSFSDKNPVRLCFFVKERSVRETEWGLLKIPIGIPPVWETLRKIETE
jgi:hypothetical protein